MSGSCFWQPLPANKSANINAIAKATGNGMLSIIFIALFAMFFYLLKCILPAWLYCAAIFARVFARNRILFKYIKLVARKNTTSWLNSMRLTFADIILMIPEWTKNKLAKDAHSRSFGCNNFSASDITTDANPRTNENTII